MKEIFTATLNKQVLELRRVFYSNDDLYYQISFDDGNKRETFRMKRDEEGMWKIQAQVLPSWIHDSELRLNDLIEENEVAV